MLRVSIGGAGALFGLGLVVLANWGANSNLRTTEWGSDEVIFLICGLVIVILSVWMFAKPSKRSLVALVLGVAGTLFIGALI